MFGENMAKDKQTVLANARKEVALVRDNLGQRTTVSSQKSWNIGGMIPIRAPYDFKIWFTKKDGETGTWIGSFSHYPQGWVWLEYNSLIFQLPTGGRIESDHRTNFKSQVLVGSGGKVFEEKLFRADAIIEELVRCFDQEQSLEVRIGHTDFSVSPTFMAYVVAIKELVDANQL